ncbi:hypothetical protein POTOM_030372 [Populus tomentosa]|uniref:ELMO domain-containing protein n=1 Tax=Populus tomentosa TaxID=118781 RepID=A0A8X7Z743_POPTO|nr:hypothetical protein POTOM_030372 [Populus tomentosa]
MTTEVCRVVVGTRRNRSLPPSLPPCFVSSSAELGVFSKLVDFNSFEMSVVRSEGSCVAIRNLSPSTSINRSCAHGSASSGPTAISMTKLVRIHHLLKLNFLELGALPFRIADMKCSGVIVKTDDDATCGTPTWIGKGLTCVCFKRKGAYERICINLTPRQARAPNSWLDNFVSYLKPEIWNGISHRIKLDALRALWSATYPDQELNGLISDQWKEMGWQGRDPSTDFRGAGFISLENLLFFAKTFSTSFQHLLKKQGGKRSAWEYPFAVAGVNITFMIMQMLDLDALKTRRTFVRSVFLQMLSENEWAFDLLYCVAFVVMDKQWLERNATYMEFNDILKSTRAQVERELLMDDVLRIEDMPSYSLLI